MIFDQLDFKEEKVMDNEKIEKLQQMIDESNHIVFFGGAGVSTESHIPDFRSTDGLYHQTYKYPPEVMVSHTFYTQHTEEFYDFYKENNIEITTQTFFDDEYIIDLYRGKRNIRFI